MRKYFLLSLVFSTYIQYSSAEEINAQKLLLYTDRARGGVEQGINWDVQVKTLEDGQESERTFTVKAKGDNALVDSKAPARFKGEVFLFNDRSMWFFKPSLKKPVSISSREKLSGQAANGDIASTHYARDYVANLEKTETINGEKTYVLLLKAKNKQVTYDQIRYWISDKTKLGTKAEFLTLQGKPFKMAEFLYNNSIVYAGKKMPFVSQMTIQDAKIKDNKSTLIYQNPKTESHPDSIFNINNLSR